MYYVFTWWLAVQLLGLAALPLTLAWLSRLPDRGYAFSKVVGLLLVGYGLWLAVWLGVLPNARGSIFLLLLGLGLLSLVVYSRHREELATFLRHRWRLVLGVEVLFLGAFLLWALVRAYNPEIASTEKPMDFAFINAILRSERFPPHDPWLAGYSISYYYFGHLLMAILVRLSGVPSAVGFNLSIAMLFALTVVGAFSLGYNLVAGHREDDAREGEASASRAPGARGAVETLHATSLLGFRLPSAVAVGLVAALLVVGVSNLQGGLEIVRAQRVGSAETWRWVGVNGALEPYQSATWYPDDQGWWWWRATRVINRLQYHTEAGSKPVVDDRADYTITEFPFFSFMLGDLHPHVMALPFGLLALALALDALRRPDRLDRAWLRAQVPRMGLSALALGGLGFLNSWDFPTYTAVFLVATGLAVYARRRSLDPGLLREVGPVAAVVLLGGIILYLPFYVSFRTQASGILPVSGPGTRPVHYLIIWGLFLLLLLSFLALLLARRRSPSGSPSPAAPWWWSGRWAIVLPLAPVALWLAAEVALGIWRGSSTGAVAALVAKLPIVLPLVVLVAVVLLAVDRQLRSGGKLGSSALFTLLLAAVGFGLTLGCELFYIRDVFGNRMNTVFKLYYQAWVMLAIASAFGLYYVHLRAPSQRGWQGLQWAWRGLLAVLVLGSLVYPVGATLAKTGRFGGTPTLDGLDFTRRATRDEYEAIQWLNANVAGAPVIVEATGPQYSEYARVATRTGLPTLLGWAGHESQWRGTDAQYRGRDQEIDQIYRSPDRNQVSAVLRKYQATYVYVGPLERARYGPAVDGRLASFMAVAFKNPGVTIYQVKP